MCLFIWDVFKFLHAGKSDRLIYIVAENNFDEL